MVTKTAIVDNMEMTVEVEYPIYYIFRHKDEDEEPFMFLKISGDEDDVGFSDGVAIFLRKNFIITRTSRSEAETYEVFGVAPVYNRSEFVIWLEVLNKEIRDSVEKWGMDKDKKVRCGEYVYDLSLDWVKKPMGYW